MARPTLEERFWRYVDKRTDKECWLWTSATSKGYGVLWTGAQGGKRLSYAHRIAYRLAFGTIPDGLLVLHHCDNPPCCNPKHLYAGTARQNSEDAMRRGHYRNGRARITELDVRLIRLQYASGLWTQEAIGRDFGLTKMGVSKIITRRTWKHVV